MTVLNSEEIKGSMDKYKRNIPVALTKGMKAQLVSYLSGIHCIWKILLVGKHQKNSFPQFVLAE